MSTKSSKSTGIIKVDVDDKSTKTWWEEDCFPSEPIFVPSPNAQSEDDGVILSCLLHKRRENFVSLLVLDANTFKEIGRVQFHTLSTVPNTFHGWYFPHK